MKKYNITVQGITYEVTVEEVPTDASSPAARAVAPGSAHSKDAPVSAAADNAAAALRITSPMPGTVLSLDVQPGQPVRNGDKLCTLEAMKMENEITAPRDGVILAVHTAKGANVNSGDLLFTIR